MNKITWPPNKSLIDKILSKDFFGILHDTISVIYSRFLFPSVKIIRIPFRINSRLNQIKLGKGTLIGKGAKFDLFLTTSKVEIGKNFVCGDNLSINIISNLKIGDDVLFSRNIFIIDHAHGTYNSKIECNQSKSPLYRELYYSPISIGNNVWIGESVKILKGVKIGSGSIINAGCVISKDIPENCIITPPAPQIIKKYDQESNRWVKVE